MLRPIRETRTAGRVVMLAMPLLGVALVVAGCGGDDDGHPGMAGMGTSTSTTAMGGMNGMSMGPSATYPSVVPGPSAAGASNDADVDFATGMIPHHGQAVVMADLLLARSSNTEVRALAERIKAAQTPEIASMAGWLKGWGKPVPDPYQAMGDGMAGMGHGGMMSAEQMNRMSSAMGTDADKAFLTLMPEHHQGAIDMATTELEQGTNPEAKKLAQQIITSQTAEIAQMKTMLAALG